jgi:hypothetical protein
MSVRMRVILVERRNYDYAPMILDPSIIIKINSTEIEPLLNKVQGKGLISCDATTYQTL